MDIRMYVRSILRNIFNSISDKTIMKKLALLVVAAAFCSCESINLDTINAAATNVSNTAANVNNAANNVKASADNVKASAKQVKESAKAAN